MPLTTSLLTNISSPQEQETSVDDQLVKPGGKDCPEENEKVGGASAEVRPLIVKTHNPIYFDLSRFHCIK